MTDVPTSADNSNQDLTRATPVQRRQALHGDRVAWLRRMHEIRALEERVVQLFYDGKVDGTTHTCQGQEAVSLGVAAATRTTDTVACTYRGHGHALALGVTPTAVLGEIVGRTCGTMGGLGGSMHLSDSSVGLLPTFAIVGAGIPVAAGVGLAARTRGDDAVGVAIFGDGATNIGAFHEGLNLASVWNLPCIFVIENNLYGEYSPLARTTPIEDLARRAEAYDMPGKVVDGQDVDTVQEVVAAARARAVAGEGPTLLEMKTYRFAGHSRSDKAEYRPEGELTKWQTRDPLQILGGRLVGEGLLAQSDLTAMAEAATAAIAKVEADVFASPAPMPEDLFAKA